MLNKYARAKLVKYPHLNPLPEGEEVMVCPRKYTLANLIRLDGDAKEYRTSELQYRHTLENPVPLRDSIKRMITRQNGLEKAEFTGR